MKRETLIQLFQKPYNRQAFIENALLPTFQGKVSNLKIYDEYNIHEINLTASEREYADRAVKYGEFQTSDEIPRTVELYEVIVNDNKQIERSRVGLGALIKKHIIGNSAVLVNFAYKNPEKRSWRFSFIARDGIFQDGEMIIEDTNPKRFTYVFGEPEETYRTALDRFFVLSNEFEITIDKIKDAFGVEAMSKAFFDEYRDVHYAGFVDYLMRSNFKKSAFNGNDKDIRDFVKKMLGRIVFLYFLQKKGWLGAKDTSYKDGDKNFVKNFYEKAGANDAFYATWLTKLFFETLNKIRPDDDFTMPDGEVVKIPYLNGGLFDKDSDKYDFLTFPSDLFTNLFNFFDQYNFTIFESSPDDHTIAVDPEMLGHIFENLLEDNKDKGAFYTPKEIVQYMTQESLIEYLHTEIPDIDRDELESFVKDKEGNLDAEFKKQIDHKLDVVKICDPAIGSGAFPMGLLQDIFSMKEHIAYDLGDKNWSPATVKENIIQNSIYGVDIERGAVDIARLRFWLSLIIDEEMPRALPNLDYKIVVGDSLVSKFDDTVIEIDWDKKGSVGSADKIVKDLQNGLLNISEKQKVFFESKDNEEKLKLKTQIRELKLDVLINQLSYNKASYLNKNQKVANMGFGLKPSEKKKNLEIDLKIAEFDKTLNKLKRLKESSTQSFNHFDWKLDFPEVLNPLVKKEWGFDIVIGNPPYVNIANIKDKEYRDLLRSKYITIKNKSDLYSVFIERSYELTMKYGVVCFIFPKTWMGTDSFSKFRDFITNNYKVIKIVNLGYGIFENATVSTLITLFSKDPVSENNILLYELKKDNIGKFNYVMKNHHLTYKQIKSTPYNLYSFTKPFKFSVKTKKLDDYIEFSLGVKTSNDKKFILDHKKDDSTFHLLRGKNIRRYEHDQPVEYIWYQPELMMRKKGAGPRRKEYFLTPKILIQGICNGVLRCSYDSNNIFVNDKVHIAFNPNTYSLEFILAILNSKLMSYVSRSMFGDYLEIKINQLKLLPIPIYISNQTEKVVINIVNYILRLKQFIYPLSSKNRNIEISLSFEGVIDALVFELYLPEEFAEKSIEIEKYAQDIFKLIEGLSDEEIVEVIKEAYQALQEKDNPLRMEIERMKVELKDLLEPILSV